MTITYQRYSQISMKIGLYSLIVQNILVTTLVFIGPVIFLLDLIGFFVLAIGVFLHSQYDSENRLYFLIAGGGFFSWIVCRIFSQFLIPNLMLDLEHLELIGHLRFIAEISDLTSLYMVFGAYELDLPSSYISSMSFSFILGGLFLCVSFLSIWFTDKNKWTMKKSHLVLLCYSVLNVISIVSILFSPTGAFFTGSVLLKVSLVPLLGILGYIGILKNHINSYYQENKNNSIIE